MNSMQNKNAMAAFLMNDNLEPATRTLDIVRLVFHFCNFVNLTLGGIAFGVGIGYDLTPINVSESDAIKPVQTKFLITGVFVIIHGLVGAYGFVSRQSRSLILYGCLGLCLLIVGSVAAWSARTGEKSIITESRNDFYFNWKKFDNKIEALVKNESMERLQHNDCECFDKKAPEKQTKTDPEKQTKTDADDLKKNNTKIRKCWTGKTETDQKDAKSKDKDVHLSEDDQFIWNLICQEKSCHMMYVSHDIAEKDDESHSEEIEAAESQTYYSCLENATCDKTDNCDTRCDKSITATYDKDLCDKLCYEREIPYTCIKFVRILTKHRVVTMYVILFSLSVTQTVCLLCNILFIFWSLKEEVDIEIHQRDSKNCKLSTKLRLLNRFLPCCFSIPKPDKEQSNVALSDIFSGSDPESGAVQALNVEHNDSNT